MDSDHTGLLRAMLTAVVDLEELPHPLTPAEVRTQRICWVASCSDDAVAHVASMPVDAVREVLPSMLDRCLHVPALLAAKANRTPAGTLYTGIRLTGEGQRRVLLLRDYIVRA